MKLQPESKKELLRIAGGTAFCTAIMWVLFAALHLVGWVKFDDTVVLGSLVGAAVAIGNFAGICFVVQKIIDEPDEKRRKATLQLSYNSRMLLQALWVVVAVAAPCFQPFASVLPLFFPRVTIYYLQITGILRNFRFNQSLPQRGLCFNQENICARIPENLHSFLMKCTQGFIGYAIISTVFRAIRKICAVRPDACQTKRIHASLRLALRVPPFLSRF